MWYSHFLPEFSQIRIIPQNNRQVCNVLMYFDNHFFLEGLIWSELIFLVIVFHPDFYNDLYLNTFMILQDIKSEIPPAP